VFCPYCEKALPQSNPTDEMPQWGYTENQVTSNSTEVSAPKSRLSTNAKKAIVTVALIVVLVVVVVAVFYPHLFPWNW
jgi:hypothetical protein